MTPVSSPSAEAKLTNPRSSRARGVARIRIASSLMAICVLAAMLLAILGVLAVPPAGAEGLPDGRVYEMVSPAESAESYNANVFVPRAAYQSNLGEGVFTYAPFQVSVDGNSVAYPVGPTTGGTGLGGGSLANQSLARRSTLGRWTSSVIQPPGRRSAFYEGFSSDLATGILAATTKEEPVLPPLSVEAPGGGYDVLYVCAVGEGVCTPSEDQSIPGNPYRPLFGAPLTRSSEEFGIYRVISVGVGVGGQERAPVFAGMSIGSKGLLFEANDSLIGGEGRLERELEGSVRKEIEDNEDNGYLYDSVDGQLSLVDVLPDGTVASDATFGAVAPSEPGSNPPDFSGVISSDGSRVYWTDLAGGGTEGPIFLRESGSVTVPVSKSTARYWTSAEGGRFAFYTEEGGLYRFDAVTDRSELLAGGSADVLGVPGVSEDGQSVYMVAEGVLGTGIGAEGAAAKAGQPNLYLLRGGEAEFIATLSPEDGDEVDPFIHAHSAGLPEFGDWQPGLGQRTAEVTGSGDSVVFMSNRSLKTVGFPSGVRNEGLDEVYVFEAESGGLFCVSCGVGDEAPGGEEEGAAAFVPISWNDTSMTKWISADGDRVFFDSAVALVPQDTNGKIDVYEWEAEGSGSCVVGSGVNGGCVYLLSNGTSEEASWFVGSSESGDDAFLVTRSQLVSEDGSEADNLFDARVDGAVPVLEPACTGTGCQGLPGPPPFFTTLGSATFGGVGNFPSQAPPRKAVKKLKKGHPSGHRKKKKKKDKRAKRKVIARRLGADVAVRSVSVPGGVEYALREVS
jgi:hypothetical protein